LNYYFQYNFTNEYGFSKLSIVRDQISNIIRGFKGSKLKRQELQVKLTSFNQLSRFIDKLEEFFVEKNIKEILKPF
jgi:hypothetical protein